MTQYAVNKPILGAQTLLIIAFLAVGSYAALFPAAIFGFGLTSLMLGGPVFMLALVLTGLIYALRIWQHLHSTMRGLVRGVNLTHY